MTVQEVQMELSDLRALVSQAEEVLGPLVNEIEDTGDADLRRRIRKLNEALTDVHEQIVELADEDYR